MTHEQEKSVQAIRFYNPNIFPKLKPSFRRRVEKIRTHFQGPGIQLAIYIEEKPSRWTVSAKDIFVYDDEGRYRESFHVGSTEMYHLVITGLGSPEKLGDVRNDLTSRFRRKKDLTIVKALEKGLPIRHRNTSA